MKLDSLPITNKNLWYQDEVGYLYLPNSTDESFQALRRYQQFGPHVTTHYTILNQRLEGIKLIWDYDPFNINTIL